MHVPHLAYARWFFCATLLLVLNPSLGNAQKDERPEVHADFQFGLFPWSASAAEFLEAEDTRLLMAAFDEGWSLDKFIDETGRPRVEVLTRLDELERASLVAGRNDNDMRPRLPVLRAEDLSAVEPILERTSEELFEIVESHWDEVEAFVSSLEAGEGLLRPELLYQAIVGGVFLGGMIDAFYDDKTLMPAPPRRSNRVDAYYAWMVEGADAQRLVVQRSDRVGRYEMFSVGPVVEEDLRIQISELRGVGPVLEPEDARRWRVFTSIFSRDHLLPYIKSQRSALLEVHPEISASRYTAFSEFVAWYYQSLVTRVIDLLVEGGFVVEPDSNYKYAVRSGR